MTATESIRLGSWILPGDYRWRWLMTEYWANVIDQLLGILVTLSLPRVVKWTYHIYDLAARYNNELPKRWDGLAVDGYRTATPIEHTIWEYLVDWAHELKLAFPSIQLPQSNATRRSVSWKLLRVALLKLLVALALTAIFVGVIAAGVAVVNLQIDNLALSNSPECGLYAPLDPVNGYLTTIPLEFQLETDSASYVADCYDESNNQTAPQCSKFAQRSLNWTDAHNQPCPFEETMCHLGPDTAYAISTPAIPATALGINTGRRLEFKREAVFTPLRMNSSYIRTSTQNSQGGNVTITWYYYGLGEGLNGGDQNLTWYYPTHGDWIDNGAGYAVNGIFYNSSQTAVGPPIAPLRTSDDDFFTLLLVRPQRVYYMAPSKDPIFPTNDQNYTIPGLSGKWWIYLFDAWARPLAAVDRIKWRNLDEGVEWHDIHEEPPLAIDGEYPGDLWLMWYALQNSHTYGSIARRLGRGLLAANKINIYTSLPLDAEQWKTEALHLFRSSLARIQMDAYKIARGTPAQDAAYSRQDTDPALCHRTYLIRAEGYTNVNGAAWFSIASLVVLIMISSLTCQQRTCQRLPCELPNCQHEPEWLIGSWVWNRILPWRAEMLAYWVVRTISAVAKALLRCLSSVSNVISTCLIKPAVRLLTSVWALLAKAVQKIKSKLST